MIRDEGRDTGDSMGSLIVCEFEEWQHMVPGVRALLCYFPDQRYECPVHSFCETVCLWMVRACQVDACSQKIPQMRPNLRIEL